jgi:hypothetical protein
MLLIVKHTGKTSERLTTRLVIYVPFAILNQALVLSPKIHTILLAIDALPSVH